MRSVLVASFALLAGCQGGAPRRDEPRPPSGEPAREVPPLLARTGTTRPGPSPTTTGPRFVAADPGELVAVVRAFVTGCHAEGRRPVVYVGATWCEPCNYFHAAALRGELDAELADVSFLELDRDVDGARLDAAGYGSRMIPLFVVPAEDGTPTDRRIEGSIHGPGSPQQILPRLLEILVER